MKLHPTAILFGSLGLAYFLLNAKLLLIDPKPWSDEAVYADIALTWLRQGKLATGLWQGMIPGVETIAAWNPPAYFLTTAAAFSLFGPSLISQRLLSAAAGLLALVLFLDILRRLLPSHKRKLVWFAGILLLSDYQFMVSTRLARPEIIIIALGLLLLWLQLIWKRQLQFTPSQTVLLGSIAGLAGLFHPLGLTILIIPLSLWIDKKLAKTPLPFKLPSLLAGYIIPVIGWLVSMVPQWAVVAEQYRLATVRKYLEDPWLLVVFKNNHTKVSLIFIVLGLLLGWMLMQLKKKPSPFSRRLIFLALFFAGLTVIGRMVWYTAYALPFIYLASIHLLANARSHSKFARYLLISVFILNLNLTWSNSFTRPIPKSAYTQFCQRVLQAIPDRSSVFISAVPDPYYCFLQAGRQNHLREFPVLTMAREQYLGVLAATDYVIYQKPFDGALFGNLLPEYLEQNAVDTVVAKDERNIYSAKIIKLRH